MAFMIRRVFRIGAGVSLVAFSIVGLAASAEATPVIVASPLHENVAANFWSRQGEGASPSTLAVRENRQAKVVMKGARPLKKRLCAELLSRISETDFSLLGAIDDYDYYTRGEKGKQYDVYCRRRKGSNDEEVLLDLNELGKTFAYVDLGAFEVSPDQRYLAFSLDSTGAESHTIFIKDLVTGEFLSEQIKGHGDSLEWANDSKTFFYDTHDDAMRAYKVFRHRVGMPAGEDALVYHEEDGSFYVEVSKSTDGEFVILTSYNPTTTEVRYVDADHPQSPAKVVRSRQEGIEYFVDHHEDRFVILTNEGAPNFKVVEAFDRELTDNGRWKVVIPHDDAVRLEYLAAFRNYLVMGERRDGTQAIRVVDLRKREEHLVALPETLASVRLSDDRDYDSNVIRLVYSSLVTPRTVFEYAMDQRTLTLKEQDRIPNGYDPTLYVTERVWARGEDGVRIPISLVYRKGLKRNGQNPLYLTGYGAYGDSFDPEFSSYRLSLLDRGFIFAIAHVRGGGEMGTRWHDDGRMLKKKNTFTDFIACAEHLIAEGYTAKQSLVISGESAGGLLVGAVVNMRSDLFKAAVARVPFVDTVNSVLDPSLPLIVNEYREWGDPNQAEFLEYIKSYSPYDNVRAQPYPHMLVITGLNDTRVLYWEAAKWVERLRERKTDRNRVILKMHPNAGHSGPSGRYAQVEDVAFEYAFILDAFGLGR